MNPWRWAPQSSGPDPWEDPQSRSSEGFLINNDPWLHLLEPPKSLGGVSGNQFPRFSWPLPQPEFFCLESWAMQVFFAQLLAQGRFGRMAMPGSNQTTIQATTLWMEFLVSRDTKCKRTLRRQGADSTALIQPPAPSTPPPHTHTHTHRRTSYKRRI